MTQPRQHHDPKRHNDLLKAAQRLADQIERKKPLWHDALTNAPRAFFALLRSPGFWLLVGIITCVALAHELEYREQTRSDQARSEQTTYTITTPCHGAEVITEFTDPAGPGVILTCEYPEGLYPTPNLTESN